MKVWNSRFRNIGFSLLCVVLALSVTGCATFPGWLSSSGASRAQVMQDRESAGIEGIELLEVSDSLARKLAKDKKLGKLSEVFPSSGTNHYLIGPGDGLEITIWETPPAMLFATSLTDPKAGSMTAQPVSLPSQMVAPNGTIYMPFVGNVLVMGRTTSDIEAEISRQLQGKANQPQVLVRVAKNNTSIVTVVGEVNNNTLMSLTPKGERLLDALAAGGGPKQPVTRMALQLSRDGVSATMPLDAIIRDPEQNILLKPGDVITALYQPQSYSVLGATGKNEEIPFEAQGISLAQALARSGGLVDNRADARGVFVFRFEDSRLVDNPSNVAKAIDGAVPVVYQINLRDPASFFVTQNFPVQNGDVIYVANSPAAEFEKFLRLIVQVAVPTVTLNRALQQ
jgi:polysaccharide export outer membrane protein